MSNAPKWTQAMVIGGSVAGMFAARVLSEKFDRVTVLDRDDLADTPTPRRGVPQGPQIHVILPRSCEALSALFPGLLDELTAAGATYYDSGLRMAAILNGCWLKPGKCELNQIDCTRPFYETRIRRRIRTLPNVEVFPRTLVRSLTKRDGVVVGVGCEAIDTAETRELVADLVVDAAGRASHAPRWLDALGYGLPPTEEVRIDLGYAGARYRAAPSFRPRVGLHVIYPDPPKAWRGAALHPVEGGLWELSLWGLFGDHPSLDDTGFMEFARTLASQEVAEFLRDAERVTEFKKMGVPVNRWHRYDKMTRFPQNFFSLGDAVCSVNPIYGQGMTKAAIHAMHLRKLIGEGRSPGWVADRMRKDIPGLIEKQAWMTTVYGDLVYPQAVGERPADFRFVTWYTRCLGELASTDLEARRAYQRALILQDGIFSMFQPGIFAKTIAYAARRPFVRLERRVNTGPMPVME